MPGQSNMDTGLAHRLDRIAVAADCLAQLVTVGDRHRVKRVVCDEDTRLIRGHRSKAILQDRNLIAIDPPVLDRQRTGGVDAKDRNLAVLEPRKQVVGDVLLVAVQWRGETAKHVVQGHVMIAGHCQCLEAGRTQFVQVSGCLLKLVHPRTLREVAADDDKVWPPLL